MKKCRILLVEDEQDIAELVARDLRTKREVLGPGGDAPDLGAPKA